MFRELLAGIAVHLADRNIPYMIIGGQAVLLYGEPRLTRDIDVTLGLGPERVGDIVSLAREMGLRQLVADPAGFVRETYVLPCMEEASGIRVDFIFSQSSYEREALRRVNPVKVNGVMVNFASPEDVIIHKLIAGRPRDLEDVKSVLVRCTSYDREYILRWLGEFDSALGTDHRRAFQEIISELAD